ncbi:MAG TPA: TIGR04255 family protein [Terracidiphilus sp.]|nr:TIGR04255 family protein [Terracidiphilus sp.]
MPEQETYPRAPILEAVLDIRVRSSSPFSEDSLNELRAREQGNYPGFRRPFQVQFRVERTDPTLEPTSQVSSFANGGAMVSEDGKQLFQARPDGFSHNRLAPYQEWASFSSEARRLWDLYREVAKPEFIEILGLNYVNRIGLPTGVEISDYLRIYIQVPPELPQTLEVHNLQVQMLHPESEARMSIVVSFGSIANDRIPVTLNVQAFKFVGKATADLTENEVWTTFDQLRNLKNLAFESCITDKVREEFR